VSSLLIGLLGALVATNPPASMSNLLTATTGVSISVTASNDPVRMELKKVMEDDDSAQGEVDGWIVENQQFAAKGAGVPAEELNRRIRKRFERVRQGYEDFIKRHPDHAEARVAYASYLNDLGDEEGSVAQLLKAQELDRTDPAIWNNLANYYGHRGPVKKAFEHYEKAIALNPAEPVYHWNFATTVYLFRKDAKEYYRLTEPQVFDKAMGLYARALELDPTNFPLATDLASSYYGMKPVPAEKALVAWTNALQLAGDELEREGVAIHLARIKMYYAGRLEEARAHLNSVTNDHYAELKKRLARNLEERETLAKATNGPPASLEEKD
jgi:tetratricopeptide (TPR) repeat protein